MERGFLDEMAGFRGVLEYLQQVELLREASQARDQPHCFTCESQDVLARLLCLSPQF